jgi:glycosyltransferase involved in cell wall biosynthesis
MHQSKRYLSAVGALALLLLVSVYAYTAVKANIAPSVDLLMGDPVLQFISLYLLVFLGILFVRYGVLILYSFLEHLDHLQGQARHVEPQDATFPMVSLVVPAYNEGPVIEAAIASLLVLDYPNYEVLVVDDGSSDDTYDKALAAARASRLVPVRVITKKNGGKADALNTGMMHARGEFILNMDGDTKLSPNTLRACIRHFDDPRIGAVAGNVKVYNRENLWTRVQALEYVEGLAMARKAQSFMRSVNIIPGPLGVFRKSLLQEVGGYDQDTFAEDCDLTLKLLMRGWHIAYEPTAVALVETPSRLLDLLKQRYRWTRGILQATRKHRWALWRPRKAGINCFILWYMLFEGVVWPISTVVGHVFFAYVGLTYGMVSLMFFWWLQLTILDLISASYCVVVEEEEAGLIWYSLAFRMFYITIIDVAKVLATIEEWRGTAMGWGKLQREGKL